ncbi:MAG: hypothetical protein A4E45_00107 [Methanosaeta sp. PtaB.Bin039]|nr:MAG: hypothetical protein A4E45_00107 [Methanosaeta sp. PtaB.Bin039]HOT06917.1 hypothetical protein [Methanotrichaceae archaeon]HQF16461.1 hypothetical protein [Methanotrichaceae archaeon]HQI91884.1 hypothetical protein [Methanotrichaceae archaeon]HQJ28441.1 hypothetical protein [Methanotrichaceae archaeon]
MTEKISAAGQDIPPGLSAPQCTRDAAAAALSTASIQRARLSMRSLAYALLRDLESLFEASIRMDGPEQGIRLAKAASLMICGQLPVRPETCPFCQEYADSRCQQCGYAQTHGGICNLDSSAFVAFLEAFGKMGLAIKSPHDILQPGGKGMPSKEESVDSLRSIIQDSLAQARYLTGIFASFLDMYPDESGGFDLMAAKQRYLLDMISALPLAATGSKNAQGERDQVLQRLLDYW